MKLRIPLQILHAPDDSCASFIRSVGLPRVVPRSCWAKPSFPSLPMVLRRSSGEAGNYCILSPSLFPTAYEVKIVELENSGVEITDEVSEVVFQSLTDSIAKGKDRKSNVGNTPTQSRRSMNYSASTQPTNQNREMEEIQRVLEAQNVQIMAQNVEMMAMMKVMRVVQHFGDDEADEANEEDKNE